MSVTGLRPILCGLSRRMYGAQAATLSRQADEVKLSLPKQDVQITKLPSGLQVASLENYSPVAKIAVIARAGSRYEVTDNLGITHCLRSCANLTTKGATSFSIARGLEEIGGSLEASTTRDHMIHSVQCLRDHLDTAFHYLSNVTTAPEFRPWEVSENMTRLQVDLDSIRNQFEIDVVENLHGVAFRDTLGMSLYAPEYMLGKFNQRMLSDFVNTHYVSGNMAVIGVGVDHDDLVQFAQKMGITEGTAPPKKAAKFNGGGERRQQANSGLSFAALGVEGLSLSSKDLLVGGVLQQLLGTGPYIKWGSNLATSKLNKITSQATSLPFATSCFNLNYTDAGLFGIYAVAQAHEMTPVLKAAMSEVRAITKGNISDAELQRAKNQCKAAILMNYENNDIVLEDMAVQVLEAGSYTPVAEVVKAIDDVTAEQASKVAKKVFNGRPSMAASGNLSNTGYLDEILSA